MTLTLIVEGTCGAGKSTLIDRVAHCLASRDSFKGWSCCRYTQKETYGPVAPSEDSGILDEELNLLILQKIVGAIARDAGSLPQPGVLFVDTLHVTQYVRPGKLSLDSYAAVESTLKPLNPLLVFLEVGKRTIRERTVLGRRDTSFHDYAKRNFGNTDDELVEHFYSEQHKMLHVLSAHSSLPRVVLDGEQPEADLADALLALIMNSNSGGTILNSCGI